MKRTEQRLLNKALHSSETHLDSVSGHLTLIYARVGVRGHPWQG